MLQIKAPTIMKIGAVDIKIFEQGLIMFLCSYHKDHIFSS